VGAGFTKALQKSVWHLSRLHTGLEKSSVASLCSGSLVFNPPSYVKLHYRKILKEAVVQQWFCCYLNLFLRSGLVRASFLADVEAFWMLHCYAVHEILSSRRDSFYFLNFQHDFFSGMCAFCKTLQMINVSNFFFYCKESTRNLENILLLLLTAYYHGSATFH